jgi:hypothetical protein
MTGRRQVIACVANLAVVAALTFFAWQLGDDMDYARGMLLGTVNAWFLSVASRSSRTVAAIACTYCLMCLLFLG